MKNLLNHLVDLFFPRLCPVCGKALNVQERYVCDMCMADLPRTGFHEREFNAVEQLFAGKVRIENASGYFFYERGNNYASILHDIKYHNQPLLGEWLGRQFALETAGSRLWNGVDLIVPVPLHRNKLASRGYNQSEYIARGIASVLGCNVENVVSAVKEHETQTSKGTYERLMNTKGIFAVGHPERYSGRHVLIVDDVVTTGATLLSCAEALSAIPGVKMSIATLAVARLS